ncbi:MAG: formate/nitrite transporter family protein [Alphaproteobacteria bacterium]|nr:MAG: formate/nitrite transporter family protein [Alphaproteobacteria bacterium]
MSEAPITGGPFDAHTPPQMAALLRDYGVKKARLAPVAMMTLGLLGGAYIALGGMFYTLVMTESGLGFGPSRLLGGLAFSLGLVLVVVGGAELFTGNTMLTMAWAQRLVRTRELLANWLVIYLCNFAGALAMALMMYASGVLHIHDDAMAATAIKIASAKTSLGFAEAFFRGILCNVLVCLGVWLCLAARSVSSKILAIIFPVSAFVALGFEHSVANMYLIPLGMMAGAPVSLGSFVANLIPVTLGNIVGGGVLVALVYWLVYLKGSHDNPASGG